MILLQLSVNTATLPSILLITLLMFVGLFFFIRASVKDRTQEVRLVSKQAQDALMAQLQEYFARRSYRVAKIDAERNQVTFEGFVRPSVFLAIFLTLLAGAGISCLTLILSMLFPGLSTFFLGLVLLSPVAGGFYWKKAGRKEQVSLKLEATENASPVLPSQITVVAHRDEVIELQRALQLKSCN